MPSVYKLMHAYYFHTDKSVAHNSLATAKRLLLNEIGDNLRQRVMGIIRDFNNERNYPSPNEDLKKLEKEKDKRIHESNMIYISARDKIETLYAKASRNLSERFANI